MRRARVVTLGCEHVVAALHTVVADDSDPSTCATDNELIMTLVNTFFLQIIFLYGNCESIKHDLELSFVSCYNDAIS